MRFLSLFVLALAATVLAASPADAQRHRRPRPTPPQTPPETPPPTTTQTPPPTTPPPDVAARDQEARMLFEAGRLAYAAGRFQDALGHFQRAHEMSGRAVLLYNIGSAADKVRRDVIALDAFRRYLEAVPTAENRPEVESRIVVLQEAVAAAEARAPTAGAGPDLTPALPVEDLTPGVSDRDLTPALSLDGRGGGGDDGQRDDGGGIFGEWWFWTIVGLVVVGGTIAVIAAASSGGGFAPFQTGDDGSNHVLLRTP